MAGSNLVWLALASLAATAIINQAQAFDSDKVYKYQFEGAITNKVANDDKPQLAGLALSASVQVRRSGADELTIWLQEPRSATFNDVIEEIHAHRFDLKPMGELAKGLEQPYRIHFEAETGAVKWLELHKDEVKWVSNFKRGLLAFFQLKLRPGGEQAETGASNGPLNQYYTTSEKSVFGECDTDYLLMMEPLDEASSGRYSMNVTKTRNLARCKSRFVHRFFPIDSSECADNDKELRQYKHSSSVLQFELVGTRQRFVIQQAQVDEVSSFAPFGQRAHSHSIESKFVLKLAGEQASAAAEPLQLDESSLARTDSLAYEPAEVQNFYAELNLEQEHHLSSIYQSSASVEQSMLALEALVREQRNYTSAFEQAHLSWMENSRLAELFLRLHELVGTLNAAKIEQLYAQVDQRGEAHKRIFWNLISLAGTNPSLVFMKRLITDGEAPAVKIKDFLARLSFHIKQPSKGLFDEYLNLCRSDKIQAEQQYKRLCLLPLASLIHQHCVKPHAKYLRAQQEAGGNATAHKRPAPTSCQVATAEEYFARLVGGGGGAPSSSDEPSSLGDKMLNVKLAGELGVRPSIAYLAEVLAERREHPSVRAAAMWQLHKAARVYPNQVRRLVAPYYHDRAELLELRLAALHGWLAAGMALHEMEAMAKQLLSEPSRQVVVYVHSLVSALAKLEAGLPCANSNDKHARLVLPTVKRALARHSPAGLSDSQASVSSSWQPDFGYGSLTFMSLIYSNDSSAPSNLFYSSTELMSGLKLSPLTVSVQAHGLDKLYKRVLGVNGLLADKLSLMDVFSLKRRAKRRSRRQVAAPEWDLKREAASVDKELGLEAREFADVYLAISVSAYGRPISFFDRDSRELKRLIGDDGTIKIPAIKKLMHAFDNHTSQQMLVNFEKLEVFNNELGLALFQSIQDFDYKSLKLNSVKLDVEPAFFRDERQGKPPSKLALAVDARIGRHNEMVVQSGALVAHSRQQAGVGFYKKKLLNVPVKVALEADLQLSQVSVKRRPLSESLLYVLQTPISFVRTYDPARPVRELAPGEQLADSWLPLYALNDSSQMKPFKLEYMSPLAFGLKLEGKHRAGEDWSLGAWRRYLGQVGLSAARLLFAYSPSGKPLEARLSSVTGEQNATEELVELFSWRHHHHDQSEEQVPLNEVERELERAVREAASSSELQPTTVSYRLALLSGQQRRMSLDVSYSRSHDRLLHKWRAFYSRAAPLEARANSSGVELLDESVTNLCWLGQLQFPKHPADKLLNFELDELDHSANLTSELSFGDQCDSSRASPSATPSASAAHVSARLQFGWSPEQRQAIEWALGGAKANELAADKHQLLDDESAAARALRSDYAQLYRQCRAKRNSDPGAKLAPSCVQFLRKAGELTHLHAQLDYRALPQRWTRLARRLGSLYTYARAGYIEQLDDKPAPERSSSPANQPERAHLHANLASSASGERLLSYDFDTPTYHVTYKSVPVSLCPLSTFPLLGSSSSFYQQLGRSVGSDSCLVSGSEVSTFDNYTYSLPASMGDDCLKLIAKDCSPEANYLVLGAKRASGAKLVKVYLGHSFKVEFVPDEQGKLEIKVNDETVSVEAARGPLRRHTKLGANTVEALAIEWNGAYYTLSSKLYKLSVSTDATFIHVQQSKYYSGKSCGLCGDANGDQLLELRSPRLGRCKSAADFAWSYVLKSTCPSRPARVECA